MDHETLLKKYMALVKMLTGHNFLLQVDGGFSHEEEMELHRLSEAIDDDGW